MRYKILTVLSLCVLLGGLEAFGQTVVRTGRDNSAGQGRTVLALRTNFLVPVYNIGVEVPVGDRISLGLDYYYPWLKSSRNSWCGQMLGGFVDLRYWIPAGRHAATDGRRLSGHAVGLYCGAGYYDLQNYTRGSQGEFVDAGVDYTYALPIAAGRLRLEFNLGLGWLRTVYRPYTMSSDHNELIKDPSIRQKTTTFVGPTRGGVSLVVPINLSR